MTMFVFCPKLRFGVQLDHKKLEMWQPCKSAHKRQDKLTVRVRRALAREAAKMAKTALKEIPVFITELKDTVYTIGGCFISYKVNSIVGLKKRKLLLGKQKLHSTSFVACVHKKTVKQTK